MKDLILECATADETYDITAVGDVISIGRGSDASIRINDEGLSRLNSTIYRDGKRIWIVDGSSTNGTYVNGEPAAAVGTPLNDGDVIRIGTATKLTVRLREEAKREASPVQAEPAAGSSAAPAKKPSMVPVILLATALMVISASVVFGIFAVFGSKTQDAANIPRHDDDIDGQDGPSKPKMTSTPTQTATPSASNDNTDALLTNSNAGSGGAAVPGAPTKKYQDMSDAERRKYIETKAMFIAQVIGNNSSEAIPAAAVDKIKAFVDAYVSRTKVKPLSGCRFGDNLQATYERASKNAPFIVRAFNEKGIDPRIGLYLAMIESEHCVCLQSPTGPLGMFQFTKATAALHGLKVFAGASPSNPDERCEPAPAAAAAASYMKALTGRYGTGPASVPLAIGSYNSGEGGLSANLQKALESNAGLPRDFWTLIANGDKLSKQFQAENFKYVPKFFAAAIIGENPQDFGLNLQPISTYTK